MLRAGRERRIGLAAGPESRRKLGHQFVIRETPDGFPPGVDRLGHIAVVPVHPAEIEPPDSVNRIDVDGFAVGDDCLRSLPHLVVAERDVAPAQGIRLMLLCGFQEPVERLFVTAEFQEAQTQAVSVRGGIVLGRNAKCGLGLVAFPTVQVEVPKTIRDETLVEEAQFDRFRESRDGLPGQLIGLALSSQLPVGVAQLAPRFTLIRYRETRRSPNRRASSMRPRSARRATAYMRAAHSHVHSSSGASVIALSIAHRASPWLPRRWWHIACRP